MTPDEALVLAGESLRSVALTRDEARVLRDFFGPDPWDLLETNGDSLTSRESKLLLSALGKVESASG